MKRFLCPKHIHHLKTEGKSIELSTEKCTICRWENRPWTLADLAYELEGLAYTLRMVHDSPGYDPHGISYGRDMNNLVLTWMRMIHPDYRKQLLNEIKGEFE